MFAIHGFDESMILGWHCDSNLAARLALYRGQRRHPDRQGVRLSCDHTRVRAANNKGRATRMNDQDHFIWNVASPYVPAQAEGWGWPDVEIEELRLDRDTAISGHGRTGKTIQPRRCLSSRPASSGSSMRNLTYDLAHTLPFVCDQVVTFPRSTAVMIVASRADFVSGFAEAWKGMGFSGPLLVPLECEGLPSDLEGVERAPFAETAGQGRYVHLRVRSGHPDRQRAGAHRPRQWRRSTRKTA